MCSVETGKVIRTVNIHPQKHTGAIVFSPDGQIFAIKYGKLITLWQVSSGRKIHTIDNGYWDSEFSLAFSSDGQILASPTREATIKLWDVATGDEICTLPGHSSSRVNSGASSWIEFSRYGQVLVSGGEDGTIKVWQQK
jgi:WD40 repeat protein